MLQRTPVNKNILNHDFIYQWKKIYLNPDLPCVKKTSDSLI